MCNRVAIRYSRFRAGVVTLSRKDVTSHCVQTRGIEEVAKAVVQIQQVTQSTAACAEESAAAAEELSAQSETLKAVVLRLTTLVGGDKTLTTGRRTVRRGAV